MSAVRQRTMVLGGTSYPSWTCIGTFDCKVARLLSLERTRNSRQPPWAPRPVADLCRSVPGKTIGEVEGFGEAVGASIILSGLGHTI